MLELFSIVEELPEICILVCKHDDKYVIIPENFIEKAIVTLSEEYPNKAKYIRGLFNEGDSDRISQLCRQAFESEEDIYNKVTSNTGFTPRKVVTEDKPTVVEEEEIINEEEGDMVVSEKSFEVVQLENQVEKLRNTIRTLREENKSLKENGVQEEVVDGELVTFCYEKLLEVDASSLSMAIMVTIDEYIENENEKDLTKILLAIFECLTHSGVI